MVRYHPIFAEKPQKDHRHYIHLASIMHAPIDSDIYYLWEDDTRIPHGYLDYSAPDTLMYLFHHRNTFPSTLREKDGSRARYITVEYDVDARPEHRFTVTKGDQSSIEENIRNSWMIEVEHVLGFQLELLKFARSSQINLLALSNLAVNITSSETSNVRAYAQKANEINLSVYNDMTSINHMDSIALIMRSFMGPLIPMPGDPRFQFHGNARPSYAWFSKYPAARPLGQHQTYANMLDRPTLELYPVNLEHYFEFMVEARATPLKDYIVALTREKAGNQAKNITPVPTGLAFEKLWWKEYLKEQRLWLEKIILHKNFEDISRFTDLRYQWNKETLNEIRKKVMILTSIVEANNEDSE